MLRHETWIGVAEYAKLAGISPQAARKRIRKGLQTGTAIHVRQLHGRGGKSGRRPEVLLSSLSEEVQKAFWKLEMWIGVQKGPRYGGDRRLKGTPISMV